MNASLLLRRVLLPAACLLLGVALCNPAQAFLGKKYPNLDELQKMNHCQLESLFREGTLSGPLQGKLRGRLLYLTDRRLPKLKVRLANAVWRGKAASADGAFVNRWVGKKERIGSCYVIGPSWIDGKPAIIMEYPPKTALFENMHDELREIAPGLYLGPVYERFPCPKFRGWIALQQECETCKP